MSSTISARLEDRIAEKLERLAKATNRSKSFLASEAIQKYIEEQLWQIEAIEQGVKEANEKNFATEKEVKKAFAKWGVDAD